mgnify:CR=1 FL=1
MNELSLHILDICQNSIKANATLIKIIIELVPEEGLGPAINDRIRRAASVEIEE